LTVLLAIVFVLAVFLVEKYANNKPLLLHNIIIVCYTLYNPITNKIIFIVMSLWLFKLIRSKKYSFRNKYTLVIFFIGTIWLLSGIYGLLLSKTMKYDDIASYLVSPYFNGVIWGIIISITLRDLEEVKRFCYFYALMRLLEIGVLGLFLYFFLYESLIEWGVLLKEIIRLDVDPTKRLISFASRNANEAAFLLIGAGGFLFQKFYLKMNFKNSVALFTMVLALLLTWTRSGWIVFIFLILLIFMFIGKIKKKFLIMLFLGFFIILIPLGIMIIARAGSESRLLSDETIMMRFNLYYEYVTSLWKVPFFHGIFEDVWVTSDMLSISSYASSENIFIDTYVKHGIFAGLLYSVIWGMFLFHYIKITVLARKMRTMLSTEEFYFIITIAATFFSVFVMANTSLFEQVSVFWILFGLSIPIYKDLKSRVRAPERKESDL